MDDETLAKLIEYRDFIKRGIKEQQDTLKNYKDIGIEETSSSYIRAEERKKAHERDLDSLLGTFPELREEY